MDSAYSPAPQPEGKPSPQAKPAAKAIGPGWIPAAVLLALLALAGAGVKLQERLAATQSAPQPKSSLLTESVAPAQPRETALGETAPAEPAGQEQLLSRAAEGLPGAELGRQAGELVGLTEAVEAPRPYPKLDPLYFPHGEGDGVIMLEYAPVGGGGPIGGCQTCTPKRTAGYTGKAPGYTGKTAGYSGKKAGYSGLKAGYGGRRAGYWGTKPGYNGVTDGYYSVTDGYRGPKPSSGAAAGYGVAKAGYGHAAPGYNAPDCPKP